MIEKTQILLIGGSAGSLEVVLQMLPFIKEDIEFPIVIIFHRKFTVDLVIEKILQRKTNLIVKEAEEKDVLKAGYIYIAPPDYHLLIEKDHTFSLDFSEKINFSRPSINVTFLSAADAYPKGLATIILSGANADGVEGMKKIKELGGICIVQNPESAAVDFMPNQAIKEVEVDFVSSTDELAKIINQLN